MAYREAINKIAIEGILTESKLEIGTVESKDSPNYGRRYINGDYFVQVRDGYVIPLYVFSWADVTEKNGKVRESKLFAKYNELHNLRKRVSKHGMDEAVRIRVNGELFENAYYKKEEPEKLKSYFKAKGTFIEFLDTRDYTPEAAFSVEGVVVSVKDEIIKEELTGSLILKLAIPGYKNKTDLIDFYVEDKNKIHYVRNNYQQGDTVHIYGDIINKTIETQKSEDVAFGEARVTSQDFVVSRLVVQGGSIPKEGDMAFSREQISEGLASRSAYLKSEQERVKSAPKAEPKPKKDEGLGFDF